jgi:type IV fimbrial biogenesis protein FimT
MNRQYGFTLLELMVTLAIMAIMMAVAVPSIRNLQSSIRITTTANSLSSALKEARSKALVSRRNVSFRAQSGSNWSAGWRAVYANPLASDPAILLSNTDIAPNMVITANPNAGNLVMGGVSGMVQDAAGAMQNMRFRVCDSSKADEYGVDVQINQFGRVAVIRHASAAECS